MFASSKTARDFQVRAELDRILSSAEFLRSKRSCELLRYLVERALEGRTETLKEFTIAVDLFERDQTFDPRIDALVRVEATRLRGRLSAYHEGAGKDSVLRIELPPGSYVPAFMPAAAPQPARSRIWRKIGVAAGIAAILTAGVLLWSNRFRASWDIDLSRAIRITADSSMSAYASLAPDASWLVYASDRGGDGPLHLWRKPVNGGDPLQLTFGKHNHSDPEISPDGKWIAFESSGESRGAYLIPASGGEEKLVAYFGTEQRFSPDGEWLAYTVYNPLTSFGRVSLVPAHRERVPSEPIQLAYDFEDAHTPMWIPPGDQMLICGTRKSRGGSREEHDLWVISRLDRSAIKTGAFEKLAEAGLDVHANVLGRTTFQRLGENLIFSARSGARVGLWRLPISTKTWRVTGKPLPVFMATEQQVHPSLQSGKLAFTSASVITNVWAVPLDANNAKPSGVPQRLTNGTLDELSPSISQDGRTLVFLSAGSPPGLHLYKKDLPHGLETIVSPGEETDRVKVSADGRTAYYRVMEGPSGGIKRQAIYLVDLRTSKSRRVCDDCGAPTNVSPDGRIVTFETGNAISRLGALRLDTGEHAEFARHSHHAMKSARISPDGRWLAFHLDLGLDGKQIFVAPFRNAARIEEADWIPITEPGGNGEEVWWSPNGRYLYFLSARDGWRCVWAREFDSDSPRKTHAATAIQHFHHSHLTPLSFIRRAPVYIGLSAAKDRLVLSLTEITSSVWVADVTGCGRYRTLRR